MAGDAQDPLDTARTPVLGFPPAGVGASFFHGVRRAGAPILGVDLPGRESRIAERACGHLFCAVDDAADTVHHACTPHACAEVGLVLVGHSFGAVVAWQVAVRLAEAGRLPQRSVVVVSGAPSPLRRRVPLAHLPDDALITAVARLTGHAHPAYDHPQLRPLLLPALRSDLACLADVPPPAQPLDALVRVVRGADDPVVSDEDLAGWSLTSRHAVTELVVPGGHMHPLEHPAPYAAAVCAAIAEIDDHVCSPTAR